MDLQNKRKQIAAEIFAATGAKVDGYDPLIIAALFYSQHLRAATDTVSVQLGSATNELRAVSQLATAANSSLLVDRTKLFKDIEAHVARCVKQASKVQASAPASPPQGWRGVTAGLVVGFVFTLGVVSVACGFSFSWVDDARLGAEFRRVVPTLDPNFRDQLIEYIDKRRR